jgi:phage shock protein C
LGNPEDIDDSSSTTARAKFSTPGYHRMYRDPENRMLGGVCAGMGAYWDIDMWIMRVIFFVLAIAGGIGVVTYLILWIVLPEAKTTAQRIEMKGEPVNIQNIKDSVKKEVETVRKKMNL